MHPNPEEAYQTQERLEPYQEGTKPAREKRVRSRGTIIKALITVSLLWFLYTKINIDEVLRTLASMNQLLLWTAAITAIGSIVLSAYKWQLLLASRGWKLSMADLIKIYFVGLFMNNFLPSSIGGDMLRIYQVGKKINNNREAAASVILERVLATVGLAITAIFALIPNRHAMGRFSDYIVYFFIFCFALAYIMMKPSILRPLQKLPWEWWQKSVQIFKEINNVIQSFRQKKGTIIKVVFYSVLFQLSIVLINFFLLRSIRIEQISIWQCILIIPIISAVSMIPVSINGLGIREGAYVLLFGSLGLSASQAVTLSMVFFLIVTAISLFGGILFIMEKEKGDYLVIRKSA